MCTYIIISQPHISGIMKYKTQECMVSAFLTKPLFGILLFTTYGLIFCLFYLVSFALAKRGQWMHNNIHIVNLLLLVHKIYLWPHKLLIIKNNDFFMRERKPLHCAENFMNWLKSCKTANQTAPSTHWCSHIGSTKYHLTKNELSFNGYVFFCLDHKSNHEWNKIIVII